jgi:hypothetical protein
MNTFDLKGSRFKRKVIQEEEYDQIWGSTSHMSNFTSIDAKLSIDKSFDMGNLDVKINRSNIQEELKLS